MAQKPGRLFLLCILVLLVLSATPQNKALAGSRSAPFSWKMNGSFQFPAEESSQASRIRTYLETDFAGQVAKDGVRSAFSAGAPTSLNAFQVELSGSGGLDQIRSVLYGGSLQALSPIMAPTTLTLQGGVAQNEPLSLVIDANLTTGYTWEFIGSGGALKPVREPVVSAVSQRVGAPMQQELNFVAIRNGEATLQLVYQRPFEPQTAPTLRLELQAARLADLKDLTNPQRLPETMPALTAPVPAGPTIQSTAPLPPSFSWLAKGKLPAIRDQGACGSCWAFAAVAPLETAIQIRDGVSTDLSEQYLVSCNYSGWSCNGGDANQAHWYHLDAVPSGEPAAGAVLESAFPYTAKDASSGTPCNPPHAHPYRLSSWDYINRGTPDVAAIKNAIYYHGPVNAAICVGTAFAYYSSGVFATDESASCGGAGRVNHAITLVGWDDSQGPNGYWILRNSWGQYWGENGGYMRIVYNTSSVGAWSSYVIYNPPPVPTLVSPADGSSSIFASLVFDWSDAAAAINYEIQVDGSPDFPHPEIDAFSAVSNYTPFVPVTGPVYWRVRSSAAEGNWSGWSSPWAVTIIPANPAPVISDLSPAYAESGGGGFTLTVTGSGFISTSVLRWNGADRLTTPGNGSTLTAAIGAGDIAAPGTAEVTVYNPGPGGGTSNSRIFYIQNGSLVPNDDFDSPITFSPGIFDHAESVRMATYAADDPALSCTMISTKTGYYTVWYRITAPVSGTLDLNTLKSNYDTILGVWSGQRGSLALVGCHDDVSPYITQSRLSVPVSGGTTYFIEVASSSKSLNLSNNSLVLQGVFWRPLFLPAVTR